MLPLDGVHYIEADESEIVAVYQSATPVRVAPVGGTAELAAAVVVVISRPKRAEVYLAFADTSKNYSIYAASSHPDSGEALADAVKEALVFAESTGFTMEPLNLDQSPAMRAVLIRNIMVIRPPRRKRDSAEVAAPSPTPENGEGEEVDAGDAGSPKEAISIGAGTGQTTVSNQDPTRGKGEGANGTSQLDGEVVKATITEIGILSRELDLMARAKKEAEQREVQADYLQQTAREELDAALSREELLTARVETLTLRLQEMTTERENLLSELAELRSSLATALAEKSAAERLAREPSSTSAGELSCPDTSPLLGAPGGDPATRILLPAIRTPQASWDMETGETATAESQPDFFWDNSGDFESLQDTGSADFFGSNYEPASGEDAVPAGSFVLENARTAVTYGAPEEIIMLQRSINTTRIIPPHGQPQSSSAFIVALRRGEMVEVVVALYLMEEGRTLVYVPEKQPEGERGRAGAVRDAVMFAETVGFMMEEELLGDDPGKRMAFLERVPVLRRL